MLPGLPLISLSLPVVPSQPPENVRAISITSDVAVISWSEPPRSTLNGVLKGYRVIFWSLYMDGGEQLLSLWLPFLILTLPESACDSEGLGPFPACAAVQAGAGPASRPQHPTC